MRPYGVDHFGYNTYVSFYEDGICKIYPDAGGETTEFGTPAVNPTNPAEGEFVNPYGVKAGSNSAEEDHIYVTDAGSQYISIFTTAGIFVSRFALSHSDGRCGGICINDEFILVVDKENDCIDVYDLDANYIQSVGSTGTGNLQFNSPNDVFWNSTQDYCYVVDSGNNRIQRLNTNLSYVSQFGLYGQGDGELDNPTSITYSVENHVCVMDSGNNRLSVWTNSGTFAYHSGGQGVGAGLFNGAHLLSAHGTGTSAIIWVADALNERVQLFNIYINLTSNPQDVLPQAITWDILTNDFYGLGLDDSVWDYAAATVSQKYCEDNDLYISLVFDSQVSVLDALQAVINHHDGYMTYLNGVISHHQLKVETPVTRLGTSDLVKIINQLPMAGTSKAGKDYKNRVNVQYTKRSDEYVTGVVTADDVVDIDKNGLLDVTTNLEGFCTWVRAIRMAYRMLRKSLIDVQTYSFKLGLKNLDLRPGQVIEFTEADLEMNAANLRIGAIKEQPDYQIVVDAMDDSPYVNTFVYAPGITCASSSSITIGLGEKSFQVAAGIDFVEGGRIHISASGSSSNYMDGTVLGYFVNTLTVNITSIGGSGTFNSWVISYLPASQPVAPAYNDPAGSVIHPIAFRVPNMYTDRNLVGVAYSESGNEAWDGVELYRSYSAGGTYESVASRNGSGITGTVLSVNMEVSNSASPSNSPSASPSVSSSPSSSPSLDSSPSSSPSVTASSSPSDSPSSSPSASSSPSGSPSASSSPSGSPSVSSSPSSSPSLDSSPSNSPSTSPSSSPSATSEPPYIIVALDTDDTLNSALTFAELLATPLMNLFVVRTNSGDKFCRFMTATLLSPRIWKLTDFIYDEAGTVLYHETGDIEAGDLFAVYDGGFVAYSILPVDAGATLYFKVASFNRAGVSEDLSTVPYLSLAI